MKRTLLSVMCGLALFLAPLSCAPPGPSKPGGLEVGDKAYDFSLPDSAGRIMHLGDVKPGWNLLLVFYRGEWCLACVNQLLDLKRDYEKFTALQTAVAAISVDPPETTAEFNNSWRFPFPLLNDKRLEVIDAYGARHPQGHEGKDISKPLVIIVSPDKRILFKYLGHSPVDIPSDSDLLDWLKKNAVVNAKP